MDDTQLRALRQEPSPEFTDRLRARLRADGEPQAPVRQPRPVLKMAASIALVAVVGGLFSVPALRASAQSFLNLFRVVNFVAVPVDSSRLFALNAQQLDVPRLIGERVEVLEEPGPATALVSPQQAGSLAGYPVRLPAYLSPPLQSVTGISVLGQRRLRVTADAGRLQQVMDAVGIRDLEAPAALDGQVVTVRIPPVVTITYDAWQDLPARFVQTLTPDVSLPAGVNLAQLGEIGLRLLGLPANEAYQFAQAIDWQTTLLVPVPPAATAFRQVDVNGAQGVEIDRVVTNHDTGQSSRVGILVWSAGGRVFALEAPLGSAQLLMMATSVR